MPLALDVLATDKVLHVSGPDERLWDVRKIQLVASSVANVAHGLMGGREKRAQMAVWWRSVLGQRIAHPERAEIKTRKFGSAYVHLLWRPSVERHGLDTRNVNTELAMEAGALHAEEDAERVGCPSRRCVNDSAIERSVSD